MAKMTYSRVPIMPPMSWREIGEKANRFIEESSPESIKVPKPYPLAYFFEFDMRNKLQFDYDVHALSPGIEATMDPLNKTVTLTPESYIGLTEERHHDRFTVAHEIGHIVLHAAYLQFVIEDGSDVLKLHRSKIPPFQDPECQANAFAAALLLPTMHMVNLLNEGKDIDWIAERFNVSKEVAFYRIKNLTKYINYNQPSAKQYQQIAEG